MPFCKVVAILNVTDYKMLHEPIQRLNVPGVTISPGKGFGDYVNNFDPFGFSDNTKVEVYTTAEQAEAVATALASLAKQLTEGGGVVAIEPVQDLRNVQKLDL